MEAGFPLIDMRTTFRGQLGPSVGTRGGAGDEAALRGAGCTRRHGKIQGVWPRWGHQGILTYYVFPGRSDFYIPHPGAPLSESGASAGTSRIPLRLPDEKAKSEFREPT
jgi:hypothetical protein